MPKTVIRVQRELMMDRLRLPCGREYIGKPGRVNTLEAAHKKVCEQCRGHTSPVASRAIAADLGTGKPRVMSGAVTRKITVRGIGTLTY